MKQASLAVLVASLPATLAWLPTDDGHTLSAFSNTDKIRGVNLGSSFVVEEWMAYSEWHNNLGCGDSKSEWDCVKSIGQDEANKAFKKHWQTWIVQDDIEKMLSYSLNTIRVRREPATRTSHHLTGYTDSDWVLDG